ncbi:MAG: acetylglutamate kinase [Phaeodactylibacter sp.]|nr:acetylglutamate kinase [Phaeodactylibacter sp.]
MAHNLKVVKIGGNVINDDAQLSSLLRDFAALPGPKILVHGGGKLATELNKKLDIPIQMFEGRRITKDQDLEIVVMVYAGLINKKITAELQAQQCNAIGLAGCDANMMLAAKRPAAPVDFGWVGDIKQVNASTLQLLIDQGLTPVFCAISHDGQGQLLNTNADTVAAEIAAAMAPHYPTELIFCFEKKGVLMDVQDENSVIEHIDFQNYQPVLADGVIHEGMLPKLKNCFYALENQVAQVKIGAAAMLADHQAIHTTIVP